MNPINEQNMINGMIGKIDMVNSNTFTKSIYAHEEWIKLLKIKSLEHQMCTVYQTIFT